MRIWLLSFTLCLALSCSHEYNPSGFSIAFTGDILLDRGIRQQIKTYGISHVFSGIKHILKKSNFAVGNLENPLTIINNPQEKKYTFKADPEWAISLHEVGFTHLDVANNHTFDQGEAGFIETIKSLKAAAIVPIGSIINSQNTNPAVMIYGADTCLLFASNHISPESTENLSDANGPSRINADSLFKLIIRYRSLCPHHLIIVLLHWGREHDKYISEEQKKSAHQLIDAGADIVLGHHPHILQPIEIYKSKPILFSLGNLVFDQEQPSAIKSLIAKLIINKGQIQVIQLFPIEMFHGIPIWSSKFDFVTTLLPSESRLFSIRARKTYD